MTSFKKPLIAIATAVALATSALVVAPANAAVNATVTVAAATPATAGNSADTAIAIPVPTAGTVDATNSVRLSFSGITAGARVTAVATNAVVLTSLVGATSASGDVRAVIETGTGTTADIYVFTKSTAVGSVAVTIGDATTTYYVKGIAGALKTISLVAPENAPLSSVAKVNVLGADVFGNPVTADVRVILNTNGLISTDVARTSNVYNVTVPATGSVTVSVYADGIAQVSKTIVSRDLFAEIAKLSADLETVKASAQATIADLKAQLATSQAQTAKAVADAKVAFDAVTAQAAAQKAASDKTLADLQASEIAKYNALVAKYNKLHPKKKIAPRD
jgi:hypothetical protein